MKKILLLIAMIPMMCYSQDVLPEKPRRDTTLVVRNGAQICRAGIMFSHSGKTYTEIYEVLTDSIVHRFGLEFRVSDSTFVRRVPMEGCDRKFYDMMQRTTEQVNREYEQRRKETIDFLNRYRTSPEVWLMFKLYELLR